jgi:hypothetical protein
MHGPEPDIDCSVLFSALLCVFTSLVLPTVHRESAIAMTMRSGGRCLPQWPSPGSGRRCHDAATHSRACDATSTI